MYVKRSLLGGTARNHLETERPSSGNAQIIGSPPDNVQKIPGSRPDFMSLSELGALCVSAVRVVAVALTAQSLENVETTQRRIRNLER